MFGKNRQGRSEGQRNNMRPSRRMDNDADSYNIDSRDYSDYSSFEGTSDRPYYGGEEGRFPYGGSSESYGRSSWNADEKNYSGNWIRGEHTGKGPKGYRRSDSRINEEVSDLLTQHGDIDASEIEVDVKEGVVTLSGTVQNRRMKRMVEDLVEDVNGVLDVQNDLRVMAQGISPEMSAEFTRSSASNRISTSASSARSQNVGVRDRSSAKSAKSSQSSSRRMNS